MITRFTANVQTYADLDCVEFTSAKLGEWVKYEDHNKEIEKLNEIMSRMTELRFNYESSIKVCGACGGERES